MRKLAIVLVASMAMSAGIVASAADTAEYGSSENKVTVGDDISAYSTVLITKGTDPYSGNQEDVVYVNQAESVFTASMDFMLKAGTEDGDYRILLGKATGDPKVITFTLSSETPDPDPKPDSVSMDFLASESGKEGYKNYAFTTESVKLGRYDGIKIVIKDEYNEEKRGGFRLSDVFETQLDPDSEVNFGLQINNVPDGVTIESVSLDTIGTDSNENAWQ